MAIALSRRGVALRLMAGLATLALFAAIGAGVAVMSFNHFRSSFDQVASSQLETMAVAARLEQESEALSDLAPSLFVKGLGKGALLAFNARVYEQQTVLQEQITELGAHVGETEEIRRISAASEALSRNADELSTVIFSKADAEVELLARLIDFSRVLDEAKLALGPGRRPAAAGAAPAGIGTDAWLAQATALSAVALRVLAERSLVQLDALEREAKRTMQASAIISLADEFGNEDLAHFHERLDLVISGDRGILALQRRILQLQAESDHLLARNETISAELVTAVESVLAGIRAEIGQQNEALGQLLIDRSRIMTGLGLLGVLSAVVIAAYFQLSVIHRLGRLRASMRSDVPVEGISDLATGRDEISEMARSFMHFVAEIDRRDTAVRQSQQRLTGAIEAISDGFSLYDRDDVLVQCNARYRALLYPGMEDAVRPGQSFESIVRMAVERGLIADAHGRAEEWIADRVRKHREPGDVTTQQRADGRWIEVKEHRTEGGDTVAIYSDVTERTEFEKRLVAEKQRTEEANRRVTEQNRTLELLSNQLAKYLSPQVYSSIFSGKSEVRVTSARKKLTIFFSDIANFTETADQLESEQLTQVVNRYLTEMANIALTHGATIDKFIGDAIVAFFGDPESRGEKEDAVACVQMAIAMQQRMAELQSEWADLGWDKPFQIRVGINTGFCTVGNFGSDDRMDYTIIGNQVNLASRLQSNAPLGGILLGPETYALVRDTIPAAECEAITAKGFARPIRCFTVSARPELVADANLLHHRHPGFEIRIEVKSLSTDGRAAAIAAVEEALHRLQRS